MKLSFLAGLLAIGLGVLAVPPATADILHLDDVIIDGSLCVGFDCVNGEVFGFDTIRLKENNLRIKFDDTSTAASFPRNDWQLTANDSANGGASKFSIDDISGGRTPFTVEANAPSHSLYVDDGGRVGFGTSTPSVELHVIDGDTPTLRLQQDGSSGFAPQTWDVAGNETNFFVRDVTNGSTLPFRIRPDAPSSSIFIDVGGDVGFGTSSPSEEGHLLRTDNDNTIFRVENTNSGTAAAGVVQTLSNGSQASFQSHGTGRTVSRFGEVLGGWNEMLAVSGNGLILGTLGATPLILGTNGLNRLEIHANGDVEHYVDGIVHSDFVFEPSYQLESIEDHATKMWTKKHLPSVGPGEYTADGRAKFRLGAGHVGMLEELEKAHIYIEQLNERLNAKTDEVAEITQNNAKLSERLARLESMLETLTQTQNNDD